MVRVESGTPNDRSNAVQNKATDFRSILHRRCLFRTVILHSLSSGIAGSGFKVIAWVIDAVVKNTG